MGRLGDVTLDSSQATVKIDEAATAHLVTSDGNITVGRLGGAAEIRTARGDIEIAEARGGQGRAAHGRFLRVPTAGCPRRWGPRRASRLRL